MSFFVLLFAWFVSVRLPQALTGGCSQDEGITICLQPNVESLKAPYYLYVGIGLALTLAYGVVSVKVIDARVVGSNIAVAAHLIALAIPLLIALEILWEVIVAPAIARVR